MQQNNSDEILYSLIQKQNQILAKLNAISSVSDPHEGLTDVWLEREFYRDAPLTPDEMPDFKEKFLRLISGLDAESVSEVVKILKRIERVKHSNEKYMDLFSPEEKETARSINKEIKDGIIVLDSECCFYNGYMLASPHFEPDVFYGKCGAAYFDHPEYFSGKDIIDAGAFIGDSALVLSDLTDKRIYAFEPSSTNYSKLEAAVKMNNSDKIVPVKKGLGCEESEAELSESIISSANSQIKHAAIPYIGTEKIEITTIDDFAKENNVDVGLIKIDVEGAEQQVLKGAMETIKSKRPSLLISIYHNSSDFFDIKPMIEDLGLGYNFKIKHPTVGTVMLETMLICEPEIK